MGESGAEILTSYSEMQSQDSLMLMCFMADFDSFAVQLYMPGLHKCTKYYSDL